MHLATFRVFRAHTPASRGVGSDFLVKLWIDGLLSGVYDVESRKSCEISELDSNLVEWYWIF